MVARNIDNSQITDVNFAIESLATLDEEKTRFAARLIRFRKKHGARSLSIAGENCEKKRDRLMAEICEESKTPLSVRENSIDFTGIFASHIRKVKRKPRFGKEARIKGSQKIHGVFRWFSVRELCMPRKGIRRDKISLKSERLPRQRDGYFNVYLAFVNEREYLLT